jgi:phage-related protein
MVHFKTPQDPKPVRFYRQDNGDEPVREWLKSLSKESRAVIGRDIMTLQMGWPIGMPLARKVTDGLWEIRSRLNRESARTIFTVKDETIILLHGFIKKSRKTPRQEMNIARERLAKL